MSIGKSKFLILSYLTKQLPSDKKYDNMGIKKIEKELSNMAKFCTNCGSPLAEGSAFCPGCGVKLSPESPPAPEIPVQQNRQRKPTVQQMMNRGEQIGSNIVYCPDGKYRWIYELSLLKNPTVFLLVWKIFFFIFIGIFIVVAIADSGSSGFWWDGFLNDAKVFGYILLGMTGVTVLGYLLYAAIMGGKYIVLFEMDEQGVNHKQLPNQAKKALKLAGLTALLGAASGNLTMVGVGAGAARTEMYSQFSKVKKVKAYPNRRLIKVNQTLGHNQVYAAPEDFGFVLDYITARCPQIRR